MATFIVPEVCLNAVDTDGLKHGLWCEMVPKHEWKYAREKHQKDISESYILEYVVGQYDKGKKIGIWKRFGIKRTLMFSTPYVDGQRNGKEVEYECDDCCAPFASTVITYEHDQKNGPRDTVSVHVTEDGSYQKNDMFGPPFRTKEEMPLVTANGVTYIVDHSMNFVDDQFTRN